MVLLLGYSLKIRCIRRILFWGEIKKLPRFEYISMDSKSFCFVSHLCYPLFVAQRSGFWLNFSMFLISGLLQLLFRVVHALCKWLSLELNSWERPWEHHESLHIDRRYVWHREINKLINCCTSFNVYHISIFVLLISKRQKCWKNYHDVQTWTFRVL